MSTNEDIIKTEIAEILEQMQALSRSAMAAKLEDMKEMIKHYIHMTDEIEERRNKHYQFTLQYTAILFTAIGLILANSQHITNQLIIVAIIGFLGIQLFFSLLSVALFTLQSGFRYPFLKIEQFANQWKWFYYGNPSLLQISTRAFLQSKNPNKTTLPYLEGLKEFVNNYLRETNATALREAVLQLYLLQVHNYFKNRFFLQLYMLTKISIIISIIFLLLIAISPSIVLLCNWLNSLM